MPPTASGLMERLRARERPLEVAWKVPLDAPRHPFVRSRLAELRCIRLTQWNALKRAIRSATPSVTVHIFEKRNHPNRCYCCDAPVRPDARIGFYVKHLLRQLLPLCHACWKAVKRQTPRRVRLARVYVRGQRFHYGGNSVASEMEAIYRAMCPPGEWVPARLVKRLLARLTNSSWTLTSVRRRLGLIQKRGHDGVPYVMIPR